MPRIFGLMLVKDEIDILPKTLAAYEKWIDGLVVLDNGSTDGTFELLKGHQLVKKIGVDTEEFDETRLVPKVVGMAEEFKADWYVESDADEIFDPAFRSVIENAPEGTNVIAGRMLFMTDDKHYFRDKFWCRMYKNQPPFSYTGIRKLHNGKIPVAHYKRSMLMSYHTIKHFQIRSFEQGMRKYENYKKLDPNNQFQEDYEQIRKIAEMWKTGDFSGLTLKQCN